MLAFTRSWSSVFPLTPGAVDRSDRPGMVKVSKNPGLIYPSEAASINKRVFIEVREKVKEAVVSYTSRIVLFGRLRFGIRDVSDRDVL